MNEGWCSVQPTDDPEQGRSSSASAERIGLDVDGVRIKRPEGIPHLVRAVVRSGDVLWGIADSVILSPLTAKEFLLAGIRNRVPSVGLSSARTKAGGLYSVDLDYLDNGAQSAELAVKLLNGELDPRMGPAVSGKLVYFLNLTTAGRVHVKLTDDVIGGAREVFRAEEQGCAGK